MMSTMVFVMEKIMKKPRMKSVWRYEKLGGSFQDIEGYSNILTKYMYIGFLKSRRHGMS